MRKIAVFSTSEIQSYYELVARLPRDPPYVREEPCRVFEFIHPRTGQEVKFASYGALERALEQGYEVFVVTSRPKFGSHDEWWLNMVGRENVVQTGYDPDHGCANDPITMRDWRAFISERLGLEPAEGRHVTTWMDLRAGLQSQGVKIGRDFWR